MKCLVIDDHALIRDAIHGVLKELESSVSAASNYRQAKRVLQENSGFGLILLDIQLPDRNGLTVLAELRKGQTFAISRDAERPMSNARRGVARRPLG